MNLISSLEREQYLEIFGKELEGKKIGNAQIVICPPAIHLEAFEKKKNRKISLGVQNIFWEKSGSFTGEISAEMAKNLGAEYVIIGHSERKKYFEEKDEEINWKILAALRAGLIPVICIGETKEERMENITHKIIQEQLRKALEGINRIKAERLVIVYEPVWAVGSDVIPTVNEIMEAKVLIRKILVELFEKKYAEMVKILYGGSVNSKNAKEVCIDPEMDGVLIGRESLMPGEFLEIAEIINNTK